MEHSVLEKCPACNAQELKRVKEVHDHFLSKEVFYIDSCSTCGLYFTNPRPSEEQIGLYYKSEDYVSHSSTNKGLVNKVYNLVRNITLNRKLKLVRSLTSGKLLLDVGAGTGHFVAKMKQHDFVVTGLEPDEDARSFCKEVNGVELLPLNHLHDSALDSFDVITMWHVLEHVYHLQRDVKRLVDLLQTNGVLIIAVPNHRSYDASFYGANWAAYDVPRHLYHFDPDSLIPFMEKHQLKFERMEPMKFDSYYVSMLSEKYKGGSLLRALRIGWLSNWKAKPGFYSSQIYVFRKK